MLAVSDLARMAAKALTRPDIWASRKLNLAGDTMTVGAMQAAYREVTGRAARSWRLPAPVFRRLAPEFAAQLRWHNEVGFAFDKAELRAILPDAVDFRRFVQERRVAGL